MKVGWGGGGGGRCSVDNDHNHVFCKSPILSHLYVLIKLFVNEIMKRKKLRDKN